MKRFAILILFLLALFGTSAKAQNVSPYPFLKMQFFDNNGHVCSGCMLFTDVAGTSTPLATYTDSSGLTPNANPVVADSAGRMNVFLGTSAYKFILTLPNGVTLWTEDNITSNNLSLLSSNNVWTGTNEFTNTVTFDVQAVFNAGFTSSGPNILNGGGTINGTYTGTPTFSGLVNFSGGFTATIGTFSGQIISTLVTGTPPFVVASTTEVPNLNVGMLEGCTWEVPCPLGSTTPNTVAATTVTTTGDITDGALSGSVGSCVVVATAGKLAPAMAGCNIPAINSVTTKLLGGNVSLTAHSLTTVDTQAITMPASGCPCRVMIMYTYFWETISGSGADTVNIYVTDGTANWAVSQGSASNASTPGGNSATQTTGSYSNGAALTFTVKAQSAETQQIDRNAAEIGSLQSFVQFQVMQSN
jgi:hypothetical protein